MRTLVAVLVLLLLAACAARPESGRRAALAVETYFRLVEAGRTEEAARLRADGGSWDVSHYRTMASEVGPPGRVEAAAGSLYVAVPFVIYGRDEAGAEYRTVGRAVVRRSNDVPGATADELRWRIHRFELGASGAPPTG